MAKEKVLRRMAGLVAERAELFGEIDVLDAGLLRAYTEFVVQFAVDGIEYFSGWPSKLHGSIPPTPAEFNVSVVREPIGVVGADHAVERPDRGVRASSPLPSPPATR